MKILTKTTTVRLPTITHLQLTEIANQTRRHPSALMRDAIYDYVLNYQVAGKSEVRG